MNNPTLKSFQTHSTFYYDYYMAISLSTISHYKYINEVLASTHKSGSPDSTRRRHTRTY